MSGKGQGCGFAGVIVARVPDFWMAVVMEKPTKYRSLATSLINKLIYLIASSLPFPEINTLPSHLRHSNQSTCISISIFPSPPIKMLSSIIFFGAGLIGLASAQSANSTTTQSAYPYLVDPNSISAENKTTWCTGQTQSCPLICGGRAFPNTCDPVSSSLLLAVTY